MNKEALDTYLAAEWTSLDLQFAEEIDARLQGQAVPPFLFEMLVQGRWAVYSNLN